MKKKVVIALGGNALGNNLPEQWEAVTYTSRIIADLVAEGLQVIITHGNGPQVGMLLTAMTDLSNATPYYTPTPISVCVGMSQGYIGYDLQNTIRTELKNRGMETPVATVITQVKVDSEDEAFLNPSKPIGRFVTKEEAQSLENERTHFMEDAGRGYRQVVASPAPKEIVELDTIKTLVDAGQIVIACGGGGIPVIEKDGQLKGASAVIDKDFASALLAKELDADYLIILTAVEKVAIHFGKPEQEWLSELSIEDAKEYILEGQFAPGSMLPKIEAAMEFASSKEGREALITELGKAKEGIQGKTGTRIHI